MKVTSPNASFVEETLFSLGASAEIPHDNATALGDNEVNSIVALDVPD